VSSRLGRKRELVNEVGAGTGGAWPCSLDPVPGLCRRDLARPLRRRAEQSTDSDASRGFLASMRAALGLGGGADGSAVVPPASSSWTEGQRRTAAGWEVGDGEDLTLIFQFQA
jgi:hypothetical protein